MSVSAMAAARADMVKGGSAGRFAVAPSDRIDDFFHLRRSFDVAIVGLDRHGAQMVDPDGQKIHGRPRRRADQPG